MIPTRALGSTGLQVSELGFGCARLGGIFQDGDRRRMTDLLLDALDAGITFFDTSDLYTQGESERLLGEAFRGRRAEVILATKAGYVLPRQRRVAATLNPILRPLLRRAGLRREHLPASVRGELAQDFSPTHLTKSLEKSLRRLRTDYVDIFQLHSPPRQILEEAAFVETVNRMKQGGKLRQWGISCERWEDALIALQLPGLSVLQLRIGLLEQEPVAQVLPLARAAGVGVIARECFAGGLLAKASGGDAAGTPPGQTETVITLAQDAARQGLSLPSLALRFVLDQAAVSVALVGMRTGAHLESNLQHLSESRSNHSKPLA
jgi:aryl-alcohol dehydrogenase-like predicted oxidoreductase